MQSKVNAELRKSYPGRDRIMKCDLRFDPERYSVEQAERDGTKLTYRAFENIPYAGRPVSPAFQSLSIYAPEEYYTGKNHGRYSLHTAPIFMPNTVGGYMPSNIERPGVNFKGETNAAFAALKRGYVVVSPSTRGRGLKNDDGLNIGVAPAGIVDLKAAVCYLRHNRELIPGDTEHIITNGTSAGGAMSALLGATGNSSDYEPYLREIGAACDRDDVFASSCYCPITNLDHADMAYEWEFSGRNEYHCVKPEFEVYPEKYKNRKDLSLDFVEDGPPKLIQVDGRMSDFQIELSGKEKALFIPYLNSLDLEDRAGRALKLNADGTGSFRDFVGHYLLKSMDRALEDGTDLSKYSWIRRKDGRAVDFDFDSYIDYRSRMKITPAFDNVLESPTAENEVFGTGKDNFCHFTQFSYENSRNGWTMADPDVIHIMNPMNYIGAADVNTAKYFRIRHGAADRDTSLAVSAMLTVRLRNCGTEVDYHLPWGLPHSGDYDLDELFAWTERILG